MKKFTLCLSALVALPLVGWAQSITLQKKVAQLNAPAPGTEAVAEKSTETAAEPMADLVTELALKKANPQEQEDIKQVDVPMATERELSDITLTQGTVAQKAPARKAGARKVAKVVTGGFVAKDTNTSGSTYISVMNLLQGEGSAYRMANVYSLGDTATVNINAEEGTVEIPAQKYYTHKTYGDMWLVPIDLEKNTYNPSGSITGTIDENGKITLSSWALLVIDGANKGKGYAFKSSQWIPANASISYTTTAGKDTTYAALVEQTSGNEIRIYNFAGNGAGVTGVLTSSKQVKISPQQILYNLFYGYFYCYPADWTLNKVYTEKSIIGTWEDGKIKIGGWAVCQRGAGTTRALSLASTTITTSLNIAWPEALNVKFEGEGTAESPYLVPTADELNMIAQKVGEGESYKGKYFKQTKDISLGSLNITYQPIGEETAFEGVYDGNGMTISDMNLNRRGFVNSGVFSQLGTAGVVKNLTISNSTVQGLATNLALLVGLNNGTVENCKAVNCTLASNCEVAGGLVGENYGTVTGCSYSGTVTGNGDFGAITGANYGTIAKCSSDATVTMTSIYSSAYHCVGGITGTSYPTGKTSASITDSYFAGKVYDAKGYAYSGGIAGYMLGTKMERCFNVGQIYAAADGTTSVGIYIGGLCGEIYEAEVSDCYNAGLIYKGGTSQGVAGLFGYVALTYVSGYNPSRLSVVKNCYNSALVNAANALDRAGIFGTSIDYSEDQPSPAPSFFTNCYSDNQMTGLEDATYGKTTAYLASGTLPEGFSADVWQVEKGLYPVLKVHAGTEASKLSAASIALANGEDMSKVKAAFTLNVPASSDITWAISSSGAYVQADDVLSISGNTVSIRDQYATEALVAYSTGNTQLSKTALLCIVPKVFDGEGTAASPYLIKNVSDFQKLQKAVATHHQPHNGDFFKMTNDIDFENSGFTGVNDGTTYMFGGTFDGDNHYIHNLNIESVVVVNDSAADAKSSYAYAGLFGVCNAKSTIKNLRMAADNSFKFYQYSAPIVGYTEGAVENCRNYADVTTIGDYTAGVVGAANTGSRITGCYNSGTIKGNHAGVAGIAGYNNGVITLSQNDGDITAAPVLAKTKLSAQNSVGGITAVNYGSIDRCVNNATVSACNRVGGIAGNNYNGASMGDITGCVNNGMAVCLSTNTYRGAMVGYSPSHGTVSSNYYDASVNTYGAASNASASGMTGISTQKLTAGTALSGLNADEWSFKAGSYPVLKAFESEEGAMKMRNIFVGFEDGQIMTNVVKSAALSADSNVKWTLKQNKNFALADGKLNVTVPTDMAVVYDTLTAVYGDSKFTKVYCLSSMPAILDGAGTADSPFQIKSKEDMNKLASFIETSGMEYEGYFFKVMNDIDYQGDSLKLIAKGSTAFKGDFDGNGKTIKGYVFADATTKTGKNLGLFVNVGGPAVIHDLTLDGSLKAYQYAGAFASYLHGTLRNCVNKGTVESANSGYVAGIAYRAYEGSVIENCVNEGTVTSIKTYVAGIACTADKGALITGCANKGTVKSTQSIVAGIVASNGGKVINCYNDGTVTGSGSIGGIVSTGAVTDTIIGCYNLKDITGTGSYVGGILGKVVDKASAYLKNSYNVGNITGTSYVGGVAGELKQGNTVDSCYNTGAVTATTGSYCGGVFATVNGNYETYPTTITNCWNSGDVTAASSYTGGIFGQARNCTIEDCFNLGDVNVTVKAKSKLAIAGFSGTFSGKAYNCWNAGNVTSNTYGTGGFAGVGAGSVTGCANFGDVTNTGGQYATASYGNAGGFWGYGACPIHNCYNMGTITAPDRVAGLNPYMFQAAEIINSYSAGKVVATTEGTKLAGNIFGVGNTKYASLVEQNNYYDQSVSPKLYGDSTVTGLTTQQMFTASLGDAYEYNKAAYPVNPNFKEKAVPNFFASNIEYIEQGDTATNISGRFYVANLEGVTVTSSENISLADGVATPTATGEGWIKYAVEFKGKKFEKTFPLTIVKASTGIDGITDGGKEAISREYYDINGMRYDTLRPGRLNIVKSVFSDGTSEVRKVYVK